MRKFNTIDHKEIYAASITVQQAFDGHGALSGYIGSKAHGGYMVTSLEETWQETFGVHHAVAVNSATSGLLAACMAVGVRTEDEVIVSPYTMSATAAAPRILGAKIVFADIDEDTFCLDPTDVANAITNKTKAVIATNLFGCPAKLHELKQICDEQGVYLIEDNAQAILAKENGKYTGTIGDIGVFSLNVHKQIQTGEGGVVVTNTPELAIKLREAMNHGEMRGGILGLNLRMTEVTAAMAIQQLKKAEAVISKIRDLAAGITHYVQQMELPIFPQMVADGNVHSYYCWAGTMEDDIAIVPPFRQGYMRPLYELPALKQNIRLETVENTEKHMILLEMCELSDANLDIETMVGNLGEEAVQDWVKYIETVRAENNVLWMDILRIALHAAPHATKIVLNQIRENDLKISDAVREISHEN